MGETGYHIGGVFRCCIANLAEQPEEKEVSIGDEITCQWCKGVMKLVDGDKCAYWKAYKFPDGTLSD
jgi:hypothetical protein